jgi:hypothetical protein
VIVLAISTADSWAGVAARLAVLVVVAWGLGEEVKL